MALEISVTEARAEFAELLNRVGYGGEQVVITRHGKPLVVMTPAAHTRRDGDNVTILDLTAGSAPAPVDATEAYGVAARHPGSVQAKKH